MRPHEDKFVQAVRDILCGPKTNGMGYLDWHDPQAFQELWATLEPHLRKWYREHTLYKERGDVKNRARQRYGPADDGEPKCRLARELVSLACMQRAVTAP